MNTVSTDASAILDGNIAAKADRSVRFVRTPIMLSAGVKAITAGSSLVFDLGHTIAARAGLIQTAMAERECHD